MKWMAGDGHPFCFYEHVVVYKVDNEMKLYCQNDILKALLNYYCLYELKE